MKHRERTGTRWIYCLLARVPAAIATLVAIDTSAALSVLHDFTRSLDNSTGLKPRSGLVADAAGVLYGTLSSQDNRGRRRGKGVCPS